MFLLSFLNVLHLQFVSMKIFADISVLGLAFIYSGKTGPAKMSPLTNGIWLPTRSFAGGSGVVWGVAVTMSRMTTRSHTYELGRVCGPLQFSHGTTRCLEDATTSLQRCYHSMLSPIHPTESKSYKQRWYCFCRKFKASGDITLNYY